MRRLLLLAALVAAPVAAQDQRGAGDATQPIADCATDLRYLNQIGGWQVVWAQLLVGLANQGPEARAAALPAWAKAGAGPRADIAALRAGMERGETAPRAVVDRVLGQVRGLQSQLASSPLAADPTWRQLLAQELRPAVDAYVTFLADEYRPRTTDAGGLARVPGGPACFVSAAEWWTTLRLTPDEIEATGRHLLAEARSDLARAAGVREADVSKLLDRLRREPGHATPEELLRVSHAALDRAAKALPRWFNIDRLPAVVIEPVPAGLSAGFPAGAYGGPRNGRPATYTINLSRPDERRLMAEVITFHETLPGHHLSLSLSSDAPLNAGFVEGWGIYAEYLADEMGLYATAEDRLGMNAKHLWAASRLIIEPGLHVRGWTRDQAIAFMRENTALSDAEIALEVDRYLAMPGQSLSYMLGANRIRQARARAERALGAKFDVRAFHDVVLLKGPRPLAQVDKDVDAWIASSLSKPAA